LHAPLLLLVVLGLDLLIGSLTLETGTPAAWRFENSTAATYDPIRVAAIQASGEAARWIRRDGLWSLAPLGSPLVNIDAGGERRTTGGAPGGVTVALLGGSAAFGLGQGDDETLASNLALLLNTNSTVPVTVRNFGTPGWTTFEAAKDLERRLRQGEHIDLAVTYAGANEFYLAVMGEEAPSSMIDVVNERRGAPSENLVEHWLDRSLLSRLGGRDPRVAETPLRVYGNQSDTVFEGDPSQLDSMRVLESTLFNYTEGDRVLRELAARYDFEVLHVLQPMRWDIVDRLLTTAKKSLSEEVPGVLDLSGTLADECFFDEVHTAEPCSRRLAETVAREISERELVG
jgi:hypothetical protein